MTLKAIPSSPGFTRCFGCGPDNEHGAQLHFELDEGEGRVEARWRPPAHFAGYRKMLHGGAIATMLDEAMGWALWGLLERIGVTLELLIHYHRPVFVAKEYRILGWVQDSSVEEATVKSEVRDSRGRLVAEATGRWAYVGIDKVRDHR